VSLLVTGLINYYKLDGGGFDAHGSNNATATNIGYATGKINQGASPSAGSGRLSITPIVFTAGSPWAINMWVKVFTNQSGLRGGLITKNAANNEGLYATVGATNVVDGKVYGSFAFLDSAGVYHGPSSNNWTSGIYVCVGLTYDGSNLRWFFNGVQDRVTSVPTLGAGWSPDTFLNGFANTKPFDGQIDEIAIFNVMKSPRDMQDLFNVYAGRPYPLATPKRSKTPIARYEYRWRRTDQPDVWVQGNNLGGLGTAGLLVEGLTSGVEYKFNVRTVGTNNMVSAWVEATHLAIDGNIYVPAQALVLTGTGVADGVDLTWTIQGPHSLSVSYEVWRAADSLGSPVLPYVQIATVRGTSYHDAFLGGTKYWYKVRTLTAMAVYSGYTAAITVSGKTVADGADVTGNSTRITVKNPEFDAGDVSWIKGTGWTILLT
jgi:Concanavalin A-like lectin/glucanases superfamily